MELEDVKPQSIRNGCENRGSDSRLIVVSNAEERDYQLSNRGFGTHLARRCEYIGSFSMFCVSRLEGLAQ